MTRDVFERRDVLEGLGALAASGLVPSTSSAVDATTPTARATYRALVDAVLPRTPALGDELGPEHVPGGLAADLDELLVVFVDELMTLAVAGDADASVPLSEPVAALLDAAAATLVATGRNEDLPDLEREERLALEDGETLDSSVFAALSRRDRLRAIDQLDSLDVDTATLPGPAVEFDGALIGQLLVGFAQFLYYGEWPGYDDPAAPPSERSFDGEALSGWEQTAFPGILDGAAVLRGYWSRPGTSLGEGAVWDTVAVDGDRTVLLRERPGAFVDNEYETDGYEEVYTTDGEPASDGPIDGIVDGLRDDGGDGGVMDVDVDPGLEVER